jgi:hypothetical protein
MLSDFRVPKNACYHFLIRVNSEALAKHKIEKVEERIKEQEEVSR